jgi:cyanophycinase-like exopeptidase
LGHAAFVAAVLLSVASERGATQAVAWWPPTGSVVLAGGALAGPTSDTFIRRIIDLAGGPDSSLVVIPTANPRADTAALRKAFEAHGAHRVVILSTHDRDVANSAAFVKPLRTARAVFLTGGESMTLERAYLGTLVPREIKAVLARGGVLAGDSAGAIALGCAWLTWLPDPFGKRGDEFCVLPHVAVSPHANAARGYATDVEVLGYLRHHRDTIGLDIDENTVIVLQGSQAEVFGDGVVALIDVARSPSAPWLTLRAGQRADLR